MTSKATATASSLEKEKLKEGKNIIPSVRSQGFLNHLSLFYLTPGVIVNVKNGSVIKNPRIPWWGNSKCSKIRDIHNPKSTGDLRKIHDLEIWDVFKGPILTTSMTCWRQPSYKVSLSDSLSPHDESKLLTAISLQSRWVFQKIVVPPKHQF